MQVIRALEKAGFIVVRVKGSHHILEHPDDPARRTTVPLHKGKDIPRGLMRRIITDVGLTVEEFSSRTCCDARLYQPVHRQDV